MMRLHDENQTTLVLVTHDNELANKADRQVRLRDGEVVKN
jgi:predicted ABC-type transport system involved in lysophospholipase L1 biosynthesis ATPase subunit